MKLYRVVFRITSRARLGRGVWLGVQLALFDSKKRQKRGRRWGRVHTKAWFARLGIFTLSGTVRYIRTATATT